MGNILFKNIRQTAALIKLLIGLQLNTYYIYKLIVKNIPGTYQWVISALLVAEIETTILLFGTSRIYLKGHLQHY